MCFLQIKARCFGKRFEVAPEDKERAEFFIEDVVGHVLVALFDEAMVDEVTLQFFPSGQPDLKLCSIFISAQCACRSFVLFPQTEGHMKSSIEQRIFSILKEFFVTIEIDDVTFRHSNVECELDAVLSSRM